MATATLPLPRISDRSDRPGRTARASADGALGRGASAMGAGVLSILGSMAAIGIAAMGLLVVPVAALIVFGPALLELL